MNKSKFNGIDDLDSPQMKEMRQAVVEQELSARSWKAWYDKMYFSMECEKLEPLYKEYQERLRKKMDDEKKRMEEFMKTLENVNIENPSGQLKVETATTEEAK